MSYSATTVAKTILEKANKEGMSISPLKLQKLLYYLHGWHLAITGSVLLREQFQVWDHDPINSVIYHEFKHFGGASITDFAVRDGNVYVVGDDKEFHSVFDNVWCKYSHFTASDLSSMTHRNGSPWDECRRKLEPEISNYTIL